MKFCATCGDPINDTKLPDDEPEDCICCADREENTAEEEQAEDEQRAYVAGYRDGLKVNAAASDMLAALQRLKDCPDVNLDSLEPETIEAVEQAEAAIAKARGL